MRSMFRVFRNRFSNNRLPSISTLLKNRVNAPSASFHTTEKSNKGKSEVALPNPSQQDRKQHTSSRKYSTTAILATTTAALSYVWYSTKKEDKKAVSIVDEKKINSHATHFTQAQIKLAAELWAQFLQQHYLSKINDPKFNELSPLILKYTRHDIKFSAAQYQKFIALLSDRVWKLIHEDMNSKQVNNEYLTLSSSYIENALADVGIFIYGNALKYHDMLIYKNGNILFNGVVSCSNHSVTHYDFSKLSLENAPYMKVTGNKFRVIEIPLDRVKHLFSGWSSTTDSNIVDELEYFREKQLTTVFAEISLSKFKGTQEKFLSLTDNELIDILQDHSKFETCFNRYGVYYHERDPTLKINTSLYYLGDMHIESIPGENCYQYSTCAVRVMAASQQGTVKEVTRNTGGLETYRLRTVNAGDYVFFRESDHSTSVLPANTDLAPFDFAAHLCDKEGKIISDKPYKPGIDALPSGMKSPQPQPTMGRI
jgi:hypothetical protein